MFIHIEIQVPSIYINIYAFTIFIIMNAQTIAELASIGFLEDVGKTYAVKKLQCLFCGLINSRLDPTENNQLVQFSATNLKYLPIAGVLVRFIVK